MSTSASTFPVSPPIDLKYYMTPGHVYIVCEIVDVVGMSGPYRHCKINPGKNIG